MNEQRPWTAYRTRFLVHAIQLQAPLNFTDALGREHSGLAGDYLVVSSDGLRRITPRHLFEDIYVPLQATPNIPAPPTSSPDRGALISPSLSAAPWVQNNLDPANEGLAQSS